MSSLGRIRIRVREWFAIREHFSELISKESRLLTLAFIALTFEVAFGLLAPWPIKYVFDGLLIPQKDVSLPFVPQGYPEAQPFQFLGLICLGVLLIAVGQGIFGYMRTVWSATAGQRMVMKLRKRLYAHLHHLSLRYHHQNRLGDLLVRITGDIPMLRDVLSTSLVDLVGRIGMVAVSLVILFLLDPRLALVSAVVLITIASLSGLFGKKIVKVAKKQREQEGILAWTANESLSSLIQVKALGREDQVVRRFARRNRASLRKGIKATRLQASLSRWSEMVFAIGLSVVLLFGVARVLAGGDLTPGDLLVFVSYVRNLNKPLRKVTRISAKIGKATACGERILEVLQIEPEEVDLPGSKNAPALRGEIQLNGVRFSYQGKDNAEEETLGRREAISGVDLNIGAGERVALVGRNGSGKSTLIHLIMRLYEPTEGNITFDGIPSSELTIASLREQMSIVLQGTYLFGQSVRENLQFYALDATDEEMLQALQQVGADFIDPSPQGLDVEISEAGANLSGGEKRKFALAGALLRHSPILILDEPTAAIDAASRDDIITRMRDLTAGQTTIVITHDPEVLSLVDRVTYLEEGEVTAEGSHRELQEVSMGYQTLFPRKTGKGTQ